MLPQPTPRGSSRASPAGSSPQPLLAGGTRRSLQRGLAAAQKLGQSLVPPCPAPSPTPSLQLPASPAAPGQHPQLCPRSQAPCSHQALMLHLQEGGREPWGELGWVRGLWHPCGTPRGRGMPAAAVQIASPLPFPLKPSSRGAPASQESSPGCRFGCFQPRVSLRDGSWGHPHAPCDCRCPAPLPGHSWDTFSNPCSGGREDRGFCLCQVPPRRPSPTVWGWRGLCVALLSALQPLCSPGLCVCAWLGAGCPRALQGAEMAAGALRGSRALQSQQGLCSGTGHCWATAGGPRGVPPMPWER